MRILSRLFSLLLLLLFLPIILPAQQRNDYRSESEHIMPKGREVYFYGMRAWPFGMIPKDARGRALGAMEKMESGRSGPSILADDSWKQIGPMNVGGRVRTIALHPTDGNTLWIGAADGGVWKSTDRGGSWRPMMEQTNAIAMGGLAVDPKNPQILYAGTGEMSSNIDAYNGAGMLKSTDGGETWKILGLTNVGAFSRVVVDPTNSDRIYAGASKNNAGFYRSTDGGVSWTRTFEEGVSDITVNPQNGDQVWIGLMTGGIQYSSDGGKTFAPRNSGLGGNGLTINRITLQVSPSDPSILYALAYEHLASTTSTHYSKIYKSTTGGNGWTVVYNNTSGNDFLSNPGSPSQGWYNNAIAVHPSNPDIVYAAGVRMVRTTDGGSSWATAGAGNHPDHHALMFDPTDPNRLYDANDGGMYRSDNGGADFQAVNQGLAISQFYDLEIDQSEPSLTYGGTQDNGTVTSGSEEYGDIFGGDGFFVAVDPTDPSIIYVEREHGQIYRIDRNGITNMALDFPVTDDALWSAPMALDPNNPGALYSGRKQLYLCANPRSDRTAIRWTPVSPEVTGMVSALAVSPHDGSIIFIGSSQGVVMRSDDQGEWEDLTFGHGLPNRAVTDFVFSAEDPNTIYACYSGFFSDHIYRSTDLGETWQSVSHGLPDVPVNALALHPDDEGILFAGTDLGMFVSVDTGNTWTIYNENLPRVVIVDLEVHEASRTLRAATHGRSMFERHIGGEPIAQVPSITSPIGGEIWTGGMGNPISWGGISDPAGVALDYSLDDGATWRRLGKNLVGNAFRWNTVNATTFRARVRVTSMRDTSISVTSNTFTIQPFSQGAVLNTDTKPVIPYGIASDGEYLWTTDFGSRTLLKLDPVTLNAVEKVTLGAEAGDSLFTDLTYYPVDGTFYISRLNSTVNSGAGGVLIKAKKNGEVVAVWNSPCDYPIGVAWLGTKNPEAPLLFLSDRDGAQTMYFYDPTQQDPKVPSLIGGFTFERNIRTQSGPRGATADHGTIWQVITDFTDNQLHGAKVINFEIETANEQVSLCNVPLTTPIGDVINARGVELNDADRSLWISDYVGNIYRIASCFTESGAVDTGSVPDPIGAIAAGSTGGSVSGSRLHQNVPNPFSQTTSLNFTLSNRTSVTIRIVDMAGREVARPVEQEFAAGNHTENFDGSHLPAGLYRVIMDLGTGEHLSEQMVIIR